MECMELLSAIRFAPFEKVKQVIESTKILNDDEYTDYHALNLALDLNRKRTASLLINMNCRVNMENRTNMDNTPLHNAVETGDKQIVCDLLMKKASILAVNREGNTPLHLAFLRRYDKITELILNVMFVHQFFDYENVKNKQNLTHMHIACTKDNERLVQLFLDAGANIDDVVSEESPYFAGYTAMHFAVENKCIEVAKVLWESSGLAIISEGKDSENRTPAQLALENLKKMQILFYHMTLQNKECEWGYYKPLSQFHSACLGDYPDIIDDFILHGAAINTPISSEATFCPGYTPLHCAVESNCKENVEILLGAGAKIHKVNQNNMTPLHLALYNEDHNEENTIVDLLYTYAKSIEKDIIDLNGLSYMHVAVTRNDIKTVKMFLKNNNDIVNRTVMYNLRNFSGFTPLHFAVRYERLGMASLLIKHGANVNSNDDFEHGTPLHVAFEVGNRQLIDLLLNNKAKVDISRAADDKTMIHLLTENYIDQTEAREMVEKGENVDKYWDAKNDLIDYIEKLTNLGCDINAIENEMGNTAMHIACSEFWDGSSCVEKLLEFGADINTENYFGLTPFQQALNNRYRDNGGDYMMLYHHVQKLKDLELKVNLKNELCCDKILQKRSDWEEFSTFFNDVNYFSDEEIARKHLSRLDEIEKMKNFKLDRKISLYDFVRLEVDTAAAYARNRVLVKLFKETDMIALNQEYPSYAYLIKLCYRKAINHVKLDKPIKKAVSGVVAKKTRRGLQRRSK